MRRGRPIGRFWPGVFWDLHDGTWSGQGKLHGNLEIDSKQSDKQFALFAFSIQLFQCSSPLLPLLLVSHCLLPRVLRLDFAAVLESCFLFSFLSLFSASSVKDRESHFHSLWALNLHPIRSGPPRLVRNQITSSRKMPILAGTDIFYSAIYPPSSPGRKLRISRPLFPPHRTP